MNLSHFSGSSQKLFCPHGDRKLKKLFGTLLKNMPEPPPLLPESLLNAHKI